MENIGRVSLDACRSVHETLAFSDRVIKKIIDGKTYNSATRGVLLNQIYFTAVQILPLFLAGSIVFGTLLIGVVLLVGLLNYVPALALGPIVEHLSLLAAH